MWAIGTNQGINTPPEIPEIFYFLMKSLLVIVFLSFLSLLNCGQVVQYEKNEESVSPLNLKDMPTDLLHMIAEYLKNPFYNLGTLNCYFRDVVSTFSVKPFLGRYLDIPELLTDDGPEIEKELKLLFPLAKFSNSTNSKHFLEGLAYEFLNNKFNVLVPHLIKYFNRLELLDFEKFTLLICKNFNFIFKDYANFFKLFTYNSMCLELVIEDLQLYIKGRPELLQYAKDFFESNECNRKDYDFVVLTWYTTAFRLDMPKSFYFEFPDRIIEVFITTDLFIDTQFFWNVILVPSHLYPDLHEKFGIAIERFKNQRIVIRSYAMELYALMNSIRFGPDNPNLYDEQLKWIRNIMSGVFSYERDFFAVKIISLIRCASLSDKMGLFAKMIKVYKYWILDYIYLLWEKGYDIDSIGFQKFMFDVHEAFDSNDRQLIYEQSSFFKILTYYYRICSVEWNKKKNNIKIEFSTRHKAYGFPERVFVDRNFFNEKSLNYFIANICSRFKFDNAIAIEAFLKIFYDDYDETAKENPITINGDNLKLIASSESALETLHAIREFYSIERQLFIVELNELLKVVDEPVPCLVDIVRLKDSNAPTTLLANFNTPEKIERLETLLGHPVVSLLEHNIEFFHHRHILKHFIKKGYEIPKFSRPDTLELFKIEFPNKNL